MRKNISYTFLWIVLGSSTTALAQEAWHIHPQWSPNGQTIAYYNRIGSAAHIRLVDPQGNHQRALTHGEGYDANPTWSPDGRQLAFTRSPEGMRGTWDLYVMGVDEAEPQRITTSTEREMHASWSPAGDYIATLRMDENGSDVYLIKPDGTGARRLTETEDREFHPKWSPDGQYIAFDSGPSEERNIYYVEVATGVIHQVTELTGGRRAAAPAWSPDGTLIVFALHTDDTSDLYTVRPDGSDLNRLTDTPSLSEGGPFWSPDGQYIAFHANRSLYVMQADGTGRRQIAP